MKVLLADPPHHTLRPETASVQVHPLGLGYLAAALAPEHDVVQLIPDVRPNEGDDRWAQIEGVLVEEQPDLLGITSVTATFPAARELATRARRVLGPDVPIVMGGAHASFDPVSAFAVDAVDAVVVGEGERTLQDVAARLQRREPLEGTAGLVQRDPAGGLRHGPRRDPEPDLDALPHPRRDGIAWSEYLQPGFYQSIIAVRGCPYRCSYCSVPASSHRRTRYRSAENIAEEVATLRDRFDANYLFFHDSVFTLHRKRTLRLAELMAERDLRIPHACQTRTDRIDPELLDAMAGAGLHQVFFGIESGHPETLKRIHKAMPLDAIRRAVGWVTQRGIRCTGFFMVGFPWETEEHIRATAEFATTLGLDAVSLFSATPLPGTELWEWADGRPLPESIDFRAPQVNLTRLPRARYESLFNEVKTEVEDYNRTCAAVKAAVAWPRSM